jgi:STE24 endopeptidase
VGYALEEDFTVAQIERSRRRRRETRPMRLTSAVTTPVLLCVLGFSPLGAGLVHGVGRLVGGEWAATAVLGTVALMLLMTVVDLPFSARLEVINRRWGLSNRDWRLFWIDTAKGTALGIVLLSIVFICLYALIRALPGTWWIPAALAAAALVFLLSFLLPVVVEPMFNRFASMEPGPLRDRLMEVAGRTGLSVRDILVSDASRRTNTLNAYVSGMGRTRRIVVWDTTIQQCAPDEIAAIAAHELGHVARRDQVIGTVNGAIGVVVSACVIALAFHWGGLLNAVGAHGQSDPGSLPLALAVGCVVGAAVAPVFNALSRRVEARADQYALDQTADPTAMIATWRRLAVNSIADLEPTALDIVWFGTHPPIASRIAAAREWGGRHGAAVSIAAPVDAADTPDTETGTGSAADTAAHTSADTPDIVAAALGTAEASESPEPAAPSTAAPAPAPTHTGDPDDR